MTKDNRTDREKGNRLVGLCAYAAAVGLVGLIIYLAYEEMRLGGFPGLVASIKKDPTSVGIMVAGAAVLWAIGFTTGKSQKPKPPRT